MKSLTTLVRSLFLSTALATLPSVYSCGSEEDSKACVSDTECKGEDRICVDGRCEYGGNGAEGEGKEGPCGNSPLNGKYLWNVGNCEMGAVSPGNSRTCTFEMRGDFNGVVSYVGSTITIGEYANMQLVSNFSRADLGTYFKDGEDRCTDNNEEPGQFEAYQCALSHDSRLLIITDPRLRPGGVCLIDNLWEIHDRPWPGEEECERSEWAEDWYSCFGDGLNP